MAEGGVGGSLAKVSGECDKEKLKLLLLHPNIGRSLR